MLEIGFLCTGGLHLSHTVVKLDSHLAQIFCQNNFHKFTRYGLINNTWISQITHMPDRFSCSKKSGLSGTHL